MSSLLAGLEGKRPVAPGMTLYVISQVCAAPGKMRKYECSPRLQIPQLSSL